MKEQKQSFPDWIFYTFYHRVEESTHLLPNSVMTNILSLLNSINSFMCSIVCPFVCFETEPSYVS